MRDDFRIWLKAQDYSERTVSTQMSDMARIETAYGSIDDIIVQGGYEELFGAFIYSAEDERRNRPNPSKFTIEGNLRQNLAGYKFSVALYKRFLDTTPTTGTVAVPVDLNPGPPPPESAEKQRLSLERDMQTALRESIARLDPTLTIIDDGAERAVLSGFIDILTRDATGTLVVIELKAGKTDSRVIGQILGYMGDIAAEESVPQVRGIIVAHEFDQRTRSAARAVPNLRLMRYAVSFTFQPEE